MHSQKIVLLLLTLSLATIRFNQADADEQPNIIFLMTDDQCTYSLGCYGNDDVRTPNIDRLAKRGMVFDRHYANTAICMASRATVMTGMYEYKTGCNFSHGSMLREIWNKSYPILLRNAGYRTAFAGKFGFEVKATAASETNLPLPSSDFDKWGGGPGQTNYKTKRNPSMAHYAAEYPHSTLSYGAFGRDFILESTKNSEPFCLSISFKAPHKPATPDPTFDEVYRGKSFSKPENYGREFGEHFAPQSKTDRQYERFYSWNYADQYDQVMGTYHQQIHAVDAAVGMIAETVERAGLSDNTVFIFTSDNGFFCGSHGYGSKVLPYEESSRIPLVIFDPRSSNSGKELRCKSLTGLIDIAPTICDLAGISAPIDADGKSLLQLYRDPTSVIHPDMALINVWGKNPTHSLSIVTQDFKYIYWAYGDDGMKPTEELYDLETDSLELTNIANRSGSLPKLVEMRNRYDRHVEKWALDSVPIHGYPKYKTIFDRQVDWSEKKALYAQGKSSAKRSRSVK